MAGTEPSALAATLAEAKRIADGLQFACRLPDKKPDFTACGGPAAEAYWEYFTPARTASLVAGLEAALKLAGEWSTESDCLDDLAGEPGTDEEGRPVLEGQASAYHECAGELREAITAALAGEENDHDHA